jgi:hypothetical protein
VESNMQSLVTGVGVVCHMACFGGMTRQENPHIDIDMTSHRCPRLPQKSDNTSSANGVLQVQLKQGGVIQAGHRAS